MVLAQYRAALGLLAGDLVDEVVDVGLRIGVLYLDMRFVGGKVVLDGQEQVRFTQPASSVDE